MHGRTLSELWLPLLFSLALTVCLTAGLRRLLLHLGWIDLPTPDRWHRRPVARPGGPAIVAAILAGFVVFVPRPWTLPMWGLLAGGSFIFAVGLIDDLVELSNPLKLTLLILGAAVPVLFGVTFRAMPSVVGTPLAMLWILGLTNAVNWLDNMDGLAAGISAIAGGTLMILSIEFRDPATAILAVLVAGACVGFLFFNFSPAKVFMGDSASGFLGLTLAVLALSGPARHVTDISLALGVPVMILSIPIFDTAVVTLTRVFSGRRLFQGGVDHPSHRLVVLGLAERQAVLALWGFSGLSAAAALIASRLGTWTGLVLGGVLVCGFTALGFVVMRVRVYQDPPGPNGTAKVVLAQLMNKRILLAIVLDFILICVAYISAHLLRFEGVIPRTFVPIISETLPVMIGVKLGLFYLLGVYRRDWHDTDLLDLLALLKSSVLASLVCVAVLFLWTGLRGYSRAVFVLDWVLTYGLLTGMRLSVRTLEEYFVSLRVQGRRVLIFGAGRGGILLLQELRNNPSLACYPAGFVDDDPLKQGHVVRGLRVLGTRQNIPRLVTEHRIEEILVAAPSLTAEGVDRITLICREAGVPCRIVRPLLDAIER
jgi:UDP-GlcNAc:undecaprenyl-phosphate/decaprenyl-phosphate GlcNAc-1-phosphate transferase